MTAVGPTRRDAAFAACLAAVLVAGILGVLLLNTAMQRQADRMAMQRAILAALATRTQALQTALDRAADPHHLAAQARLLHLSQTTAISYVTLARASER